MDFFSMFRRSKKTRKASKNATGLAHSPSSRPGFEALEDRLLLASNVISGHVFHDANNNGIFDQGESPIANSLLELRDATGKVIATAITDANGYYEFTHDSSVNTAPVTIEQTITIPTTLAGFTLTEEIQQFNPALGELLAVEIIHNGSITSEIRAENSSTHVGATITGIVSGKMTLSGPGFTLETTVSENAGSFFATPYDGVLDFDGSSGQTLAPSTAIAPTKSVTLTGAEMAAFLGTGVVHFTEEVEVSSTATGGGNLMVGINSSATATFTVRYTYRPDNGLKPGEYTIVQTEQPFIPGTQERYFDGLESKNGVVLPGTVGTDIIPVALNGGAAHNNNFGEVAPASLSGSVYYDQNNNGLREASEPGIAGVLITLAGVNDLGQTITRTATTAVDGSYRFDNLRPGTYTLTEQQPAGWFDGKDTLGSLGGVLGNDQFTHINVLPGAKGTQYNFGEIQAAALSGFVYHDENDNGIMDIGEPGLGGVTVVLTGTDDRGAVNRATTTEADGSYRFDNLRPGIYTIEQVQPEGWHDGKDSLGSLGGTLFNDRFSNINVPQGVTGVNYNFGERIAADVAIDKSVSTDVAQAGSTITYTLKVSNLGPSTAENVRVEDTLPDGVMFVSASATGWLMELSGNTISFTRDSLASGTTSTITITAVAPVQSGTYHNTAQVTTTTFDINLSNNEDDATFRVPSQPTNPQTPPPDPCVLIIYSYDAVWLNMLKKNV